MKKLHCLVSILLLLFSCSKKEEEAILVTLKFSHHWDGVELTNQDFNQLKFTNVNGNKLSIERLRYVISNINLVGVKNYFLVDVGEIASTSIALSIPNWGSQDIKFNFGFKDEDNLDGIYQDLNSVNFNVPRMLGGGYHYMQFDGKYLNANNQEAGFNYHAIRAVNKTDPENLIFQDTSFEVNLGNVIIKKNTEIEIKMNVAEWFKNPNRWNLNELNQALMPNFDAQILMSQNGKSVFSLGKVIE